MGISTQTMVDEMRDHPNTSRSHSDFFEGRLNLRMARNEVSYQEEVLVVPYWQLLPSLARTHTSTLKANPRNVVAKYADDAASLLKWSLRAGGGENFKNGRSKEITRQISSTQ